MGKMRLRHYSEEPIKRILDRGYKTKQEIGPKPKGFWLSDERGYGWKWWCRGEHFHLGGLAYEYEIRLAPKTRILYLRSIAELDAFTTQYKAASETNRLMEEVNEQFAGRYPGLPQLERVATIMDIDWPRVQAAGWQGIIITPYQWERRLTNHTMWYYGWDCASGVIWDTKALGRFRLRRVRKKFVGVKDPTGEELMNAMRESAAALAEMTKDTDHPFPTLEQMKEQLDRVPNV